MAYKDYALKSILVELEEGASFWYNCEEREAVFISLDGIPRDVEFKVFYELLLSGQVVKYKDISKDCAYYISANYKARLDQIDQEENAVYNWLNAS